MTTVKTPQAIADLHTMASALLECLYTANSIERYASSRDNVYGDCENALKRLGPLGVAMYEEWTNTNEILTLEALTSIALDLVTKLATD